MFVCCHWLNACGWVGVSFFLSFFLSVCLMPDAYIHENHLHAVAVFIYRNHCIRMAKKRNKMSSTKLSWLFQRAENEWLKTANTPINIGWWKKKMCTHSQTQIQTHVHTCIPLNEATTVRWHNIKANKTAEPKRMRGDEKKMHRQSFNRKICSGYGSDSRQLDGKE